MKNNILDRYAERAKTAALKEQRQEWIRQIILVFIPCSLFFVPMRAQSDSALNRSVTVERDFQPVIQAAGKVSTKPAIIETKIEPAKVEFSQYNHPLPITGYQSPNLLSQPTRFEAGQVYNGYIRGAVGHPNTLFDFGYRLDDGKKSILNAYAHHHAEWGMAALSKTKVGLNFTHPFSTCDIYFGVSGSNIYYHKYGRWYDYSQPWGMWDKNKDSYSNRSPITHLDQTSLWSAEAFLGVKANEKQDIQYMAQTGYVLFSKPGAVSEHQIRTRAFFDWHADEHHVGANLYVQNNFTQLGSLAAVIPDSMFHNNRHNLRIEPYYAYEGKRIRVHAGVNLDVNIGHGRNALSATEDISFAPSPHVFMEAQVAKQWLTVYADVMGNHGMGTLQSYMEENRYRLIHAGVIEPHYAEYTPVDAEVGLRIRPYRDLFLEIHGGYAYMMHQDVWIATTDSALFAPLNVKLMQGDFSYLHTDYQRGKVGGVLNYHYRDIVRINVQGDYYFWKGDITVYDRPNWDLNVRIDGRIDEHWSLYSDNRFVGSRLALAYSGTTDTYSDHVLAPVIDLNLGLQYEMFVGSSKSRNHGTTKSREHKSPNANHLVLRPEQKPNLALFFQLNNWLHRKNELLYGYRSQGINFLLGATYRF